MTDRAPPPGSLAGARGDEAIEAVAGALAEANAEVLRKRELSRRVLPSREDASLAVADLRAALFPWHFGVADAAEHGLVQYIRRTLEHALARLRGAILRGLLFECEHGVDECRTCEERADDLTTRFAAQLPAARLLLETDAWAAFHGDPAATSPDEAVFCYPGMVAIIHHRIAHELYLLGVPLVPRMISELSHAATGIDIHPGARIGASFFIDHGTGVVVGETTVIGERVRLYQGVTLGARSFPLDDHGRPIKGIARHPIVEDDVVIYAGATILGRITIGHGSTIGGNVWVTSSLPPNTHVTQAQFRQELFDGGAGI
jgi:serine O-acetyltransferase